MKHGDESGGAVYSPCMAYRYILTRALQPALSAPCIPVCFLMLNPSTATHSDDDPTIRRCRRFAERWGGDRLVVVNIFAFRATDPKHMKRQPDAIGAHNRVWIEHAVATTLAPGGLVVAAWGGHGTHREHDATVVSWLRDIGAQVYCLGTTEKDDQPRHPLFVPKQADPIPFTPTMMKG